MMHDDRTLAPSGSSTDSAAVAVPLQNRFTKPAKILLILPFQRVTSRAQSVCKNLLVSAPTVHSELCTFLHSPSKPRTPRLISVSIQPSFQGAVRSSSNGTPFTHASPTVVEEQTPRIGVVVFPALCNGLIVTGQLQHFDVGFFPPNGLFCSDGLHIE
jgi:hypothetical protein